MPILTMNDAERIAARGRPWATRMETTGPANGRFWKATGRGVAEAVEVSQGVIGGVPQSSELVAWDEFKKRAAGKVAEGYSWVDTPYFRMSPDNIALLKNGRPSVLPGIPAVAAIPAAPAAKSPAASLLALPSPWDQIRALRVVRDGVVVKGFDAVDDRGNVITRFDEDPGRDFARKHDVDMIWTSSKTV